MDVSEHTAAEHVKSTESLLREVLARLLEQGHGKNWEQQLSRRVRDECEKVASSERSARPHARDEENLLGYAGFDQLKAVARHHWTCCVNTYGLWPSEEWAIRDLDRLHAVRNPAQHGRTLFPHEFIEAEGLSRRLRFEIERRRREIATMSDEYWLYIEEAEDSVGNRQTNPGGDSNIIVYRSTRLNVGDTVSLRVRAFDPWGRPLTYRLYSNYPKYTTPWQEQPEFEWTAGTVARRVVVDIEVRAEGEPHPGPDAAWDAFARFTYEVRSLAPALLVKTEGTPDATGGFPSTSPSTAEVPQPQRDKSTEGP
jgi:hypothetical protein